MAIQGLTITEWPGLTDTEGDSLMSMLGNLTASAVSEQSVGFWQMALGQAGNNAIALMALTVSTVIGVFVYRSTEGRERRIEKSSAYLQLEMHSSEAFRYEAEHAAAMKPARELQKPANWAEVEDKAADRTRHFYFQCLNLFEVCANFRRNNVIQRQVFASWVAWFYDILSGWYFREIWDAELRSNYTRDVRNIFDVGIHIFRTEEDPDVRERRFYEAVAYLIGDCDMVAGWLDEMAFVPVWPPSAPPRWRLPKWMVIKWRRPRWLAPAPHIAYRPKTND
jgi:hypothetical protein